MQTVLKENLIVKEPEGSVITCSHVDVELLYPTVMIHVALSLVPPGYSPSNLL